MTPARIVLIGGTSHTGKSTLARLLAERLGATSHSTDGLARHPGRPWPAAFVATRPHVAEHYRDLSHEERMASVLAHYRGMQPLIRDLVDRQRLETRDEPVVIEGSALLPETVATLDAPGIRAIWLVADAQLLRNRIEEESGYAQASPTLRPLIEAFLERALRFNSFLSEELERRRLPSLTVRAGVTRDQLVDEVEARARA